MPNYVTSTCRLIGPDEDVARFRSEIIRTAPAGHSDAGGLLFDFDAVIPMPSCLRDADESSRSELGMSLVTARGSTPPPFSKLGLYDNQIEWVRSKAGLPYDAGIGEVAAAFLLKHPEIEQMGMSRIRALAETGFASWYPWALANWGTKWGAFRFAETGAEPFAFRFETAWSFPVPIFEALATRFPSLGFECATFDEGWNFAGAGWFNPPAGEPCFAECEASATLYKVVYGRPPEPDED
ncbi:hypothetical protein ACFSGX_09845 [Sphingomonas arantia]|uniref:YubB ferredoxin-like domain-containing protein n=1 Tax=Sphingomonas arantia TaxID=1460676 RepID=A0ABW4TWH4_9SPHN